MMGTKIVVNPDGTQSIVPTTPADDAQAAADATAFQAQQAANATEQARLSGLSSDANVMALLTQASTASTAQIDTWLTNNVTTLQQARTVLGALIKIVAVKVIG